MASGGNVGGGYGDELQLQSHVATTEYVDSSRCAAAMTARSTGDADSLQP